MLEASNLQQRKIVLGLITLGTILFALTSQSPVTPLPDQPASEVRVHESETSTLHVKLQDGSYSTQKTETTTDTVSVGE